MRNLFPKVLLLGAAATVLTFAACEKAIDDVRETTTSAEDIVIAESAIASAFDVVDDISSTDGRMQKNGSTLLPSGAVVEFTDSSFTDGDGVEFSVDFGAYDANQTINGLLCADGKFRAGKVTITANKPYTELGCVIEATFADGSDAYYIGDGTNMAKVLGALKATRTGTETATLEVIGGKVVYSNGTVEFNSSKTIKRTVGNGQPGSYGDQYEVTGSGDGKNRDGQEFTINITKTLLQKVEDGCASTFVEGVMELKITESGATLKIDFDPEGDGACDRLVRVTLPSGLKKDIQIKN